MDGLPQESQEVVTYLHCWIAQGSTTWQQKCVPNAEDDQHVYYGVLIRLFAGRSSRGSSKEGLRRGCRWDRHSEHQPILHGSSRLYPHFSHLSGRTECRSNYRNTRRTRMETWIAHEATDTSLSRNSSMPLGLSTLERSRWSSSMPRIFPRSSKLSIRSGRGTIAR